MTTTFDYEKWAISSRAISVKKAEDWHDRGAVMANPDLMKAASEWEDEQEESQKEHFLLEKAGDIGIITIDGMMIQGSAGYWGSYWGVVGYDDIRNALICAMNAGCKAAMVNITSPGGQVFGIGELSDFIKDIHATMPITFFAGSYAASGGVWLGTTTGRFFASRHAEIGSVGVIAVATEYTKYNNQMGITKRVFKSTPLKGTGNPNEKLSDAGSEEIMRGVNDSAQRFVQHVAQSMSLSFDYVDNTIHTGQEWYAEEALQLGLITGITTFDQLLVDLQDKVNQNTSNALGNSRGQSTFTTRVEADMAKKMTLSNSVSDEEALALAASGIVQAAETASSDKEDDDEDKTPSESENDKDGDPDVEQEVEGDEAATAGAVDKSMVGMLDKLTDKLAAAKVEVATMTSELAVAKTQMERMAATELALKGCVALATQRMVVGAGGSAPDLEGLQAMAADDLVKQFASADDVMKKRFAAGRQTLVKSEEDSDEETKLAEQAAKVNSYLLSDQVRISSK